MKLINSSIVFVINKGLIPSTLLNVFEKYQVLSTDRITKPKIHIPVSPTIIDLEDGSSIHILPTKIIIQINYAEPGDLGDIESIPDKLLQIAENIVPLINSMEVKALGINFKIFSSENKLVENLFNLPNDSEIIDFKFQMKKDVFLLINTVNRIIIENNNGLLLDSNFHLDLKGSHIDKLILESLSKREACFKILQELINEIFTRI